ncbi:hypothetical protein H8356DRAFT_1327386 [Neocallimastix lanati (nom. inval.)]|nr:hypothetical protein H8356DRAFT_1327386 [Neocallimastix sp. JGI-2020a]
MEPGEMQLVEIEMNEIFPHGISISNTLTRENYGKWLKETNLLASTNDHSDLYYVKGVTDNSDNKINERYLRMMKVEFMTLKNKPKNNVKLGREKENLNTSYPKELRIEITHNNENKLKNKEDKNAEVESCDNHKNHTQKNIINLDCLSNIRERNEVIQFADDNTTIATHKGTYIGVIQSMYRKLNYKLVEFLKRKQEKREVLYSDIPFLMVTAALLPSMIPIAIIGQVQIEIVLLLPRASILKKHAINEDHNFVSYNYDEHCEVKISSNRNRTTTTKGVNTKETVRQARKASATNEDHNFVS